jgi:glucans biosynthesis protein
MTRFRQWCVGVVALGMALAAGAAVEPRFDFAALQARAKELATRDHQPPQGEVPGWLRQLSYDQLRRIEFDGRQSLWVRDRLPFAVQYLHPGFLFDRVVRLHELQGGAVRTVPFRREYFNYRDVEVGPMPASMGFAGFRLMFPLDGRDQPYSEIGSFAGASYFRFLCAGAAYGLSARGLALDTAEPTPEEFPRFSEFWLERPEAGSAQLVVLALLESERVTGAYRFAVAPGKSSTVEVKAALYFRRAVKVVGLAPLTSMFWRGENSHSSADDFRPEVHDSDGLALHTGAGEWIWRPLVNGRQLRVATFADEDPRGFGLLQRDRNFENYQDLEASYHTRPGVWVEPMGKWGRGGVRLVEIPTTTEFDDNIVACWVPEKAPQAGESMELEYRLHWSLGHDGARTATVRSTRSGKAAYYEPGLHRFVVDFEGGKLPQMDRAAPLEPVVSVGAGARLHHAAIQRNAINGTWRVAFTIRPDDSGRPVELRCFVRQEREALTETWSYLWSP